MLREALLLLAWLAPLLAFPTAAPGKRGPSPQGWAEVAGPLCGTSVRVPKGQAAIWVDAGWCVPGSLAGVCAGSEAGAYSPAGMMGFFWVEQLSPGNHIGGQGRWMCLTALHHVCTRGSSLASPSSWVCLQVVACCGPVPPQLR